MALTMRFCCGLLFISGVVSEGTCQRDAICADLGEESREHHNISNSSGGWRKDESAGYLTDGYIVALTGMLEWLQVGDYAGTEMGEGEKEDIIGRIEGDFCPTYNAVFTTTNKFGLVCSIEITKPVNETESSPDYYCNIKLQSWSISMLYYRPAAEEFTLVSNIYVYFDTKTGTSDPTWSELNFTIVGENSDIRSYTLASMFFVQLDGITYIRAKALTFAYENGGPETTTTASPTVRRRLSASGGGMDYAAGFMSFLPLSQIVFLGLCIGSSVFAGQVLLSYTQSFKN